MTPGSQLATLLERELDCLRQLRSILDREHQALLAADAQLLEDVTREKNHILGCQAEASRQRRDFLQRSGFDAGEEGLEDFIAACDNRDQLQESQGEIRVLARHCHESNRGNGRLIARRQQQTQGALGILRQSEPAAPTYSGAGSTGSGGSSRLLGKA